MKIKLTIKKNISTAVLAFWIFYFMAIHIKTGTADLYFPVMIIGMSIFSWIIIMKRQLCKKLLKPVIIFSIFGLLAITCVGNVFWYNLFFILAHVGIALALSISKNTLRSTYQKIFWILICIYIIYYALNHTFDTFYNLASENMVSIYLMLFYYLYCRENENANKKMPLIATIFILVLTFLSGSRTGLACSFILFIGILIINLVKRNGEKIFVLFWLVLILVVAGTLIFFGISFLKEVLNDTPRLYIWNMYFSELTNWKNFVLGVPFSSKMVFGDYINNLHNTFMNIHAKYGLVSLITI